MSTHGRPYRRFWGAVCALSGLVCLLIGVWIPLKGWLAQQLLAQAWEDSQRAHADVRPWPWADTWPVARLHLPAQGAALTVLSGVAGEDLAFGPGHLPGSALPGAAGRSVVAGHRDTHFRILADLLPGHPVEVESRAGHRRVYRVVRREVVDSRHARLQLWDLDAGEDQLVLVTCYPFDATDPGGPLRYVVTAVAEEAGWVGLPPELEAAQLDG